MDRRLQTYVTATLLTAAAGQLASTADAVTVGQFVDIDAVSVLSLIMPVTVVISCMGLLLGFGANALSARAIGQHNERATIRIFSTAMLSLTVVGLFLSLLLWREAPVVSRLLTNENDMRMLATDYLSVYALGAWLEMVSYGLCLFVATDGNPLRVSVAIAIGVVANVIADILLIGFLDMGMKGAALGSILQFAITTLLLAVHLRFSDSHFRFQWPVAGFKYHLLTNIKEGTPITLSSLLMAVILLLINSITYHTLGADGLFFWSVCLQMLLITFIFINGTTEALFAIGEVMMGKGQALAVRVLFRQSLLISCGMTVLLMVIMAVPDAVAIAFGVEEEPMLSDLTRVLRIFSLMLIPFTVSYLLAAYCQIQGCVTLSAFMLACQLLWTLFVLWVVSHWAASHLWWAFPLSSTLYLLGQVVFLRQKYDSIKF
ncbi:MAG: hypothetical protein IJ546_07060 [Prevotella sp.]|nr:hypothetical protein [Prevotella sp.]